MIVQSIQCDKCKKIIAKDSEDYFTISGELKRGKEYYTANNEDAHICSSCFLKHFNLMVATPRESFTPEKQGDILKRKIEDTGPYTPLKGEPTPYDKAIRYELPFEVTCTGPTKTDSMVARAVAELTKLTNPDSYQICAGKTCVTITPHSPKSPKSSGFSM